MVGLLLQGRPSTSELFACSIQPGPHGSQWDREYVCYFSVLQTLNLTQYKRCAQGWGERVKHLLYRQSLLNIRVDSNEVADRVLERQLRAGRLTPHPIETQVDYYAVEPGIKSGLSSELANLPESFNKSLLCHVFRFARIV